MLWAQSGPYDEVSLSFLVCSSGKVGIDEPPQAWNFGDLGLLQLPA